MALLELLAPARTADIGIAAIDCGADAVYIAGPAFGARQAAGNSVEDIARLCGYAHRFGARIFVTVNTLVYEAELPEMRSLVDSLASAGADAIIIQDLSVLEAVKGSGMAPHASTQFAIRSVEDALRAESLGFGRLVLERQLPLSRVREIRAAIRPETELEFFVHGALCMCYSGQCYLSEYLTGRSANRGACAQACRSLYDLQDASGRTIVRNKALLSLKDFNLIGRLEDLADAGVCSFKIEGRLKSESYVRNVTRAYSMALDALVSSNPGRWQRSSFGRVTGGFVPDLSKSFNRGYTRLFLDGEKERGWSSMDVPTSLGEAIGKVEKLLPGGIQVQLKPGIQLRNGDGLSFIGPSRRTEGFRADVVDGRRIRCKLPEGLAEGTALYRNLDSAFERQIEQAPPLRLLGIRADVRFIPDSVEIEAVREDGAALTLTESTAGTEPALNRERMLELVRAQLEKRSGNYAFSLGSVQAGPELPFLSAAFLNGLRRSLAQRFDSVPIIGHPLSKGAAGASIKFPEKLDYKANVANSVSRGIYEGRGVKSCEEAYEISHRSGVELMRSKYCVRYELGLCPRQDHSNRPEPLFLLNAGRRLRLDFDCPSCEMTVSQD